MKLHELKEKIAAISEDLDEYEVMSVALTKGFEEVHAHLNKRKGLVEIDEYPK
jgi:hypothetical protein